VSRVLVCLAALTVILTMAASCSSSGTSEHSANDPSCVPPGAAIEAPESLKPSRSDVEKVLARSCALGGCHAGSPGAGDLTFPLGSGAWVANVVGQPSSENRAMNLVEAGDPARSWMVLKLTGAYCFFAKACASEVGCGQRMPFGEELSMEDKEILVAWIRGGANAD
jgi:hypothetical protein